MFLTLPREIRDLILDEVLSCRRLPPMNNHDVADGSRAPVHTYEYMSWVGLKGLVFETSQPNPPAQGLLRTNKQLREETLQAIERLSKEDSAFALDLMFVEEKEVWPTWINIPFATNDVQRLEVDVRVVGAMKELGAGYSRTGTIWVPGNGAPPAIVWPFYALLEHVLHHGFLLPRKSDADRYQRRNKPEKAYRGIVIRNLVLSFSTSASDAELAGSHEQLDWFQARNSRFGDPEPLEDIHHKVMRPEWLAEYLLDFFQMLLGMSYHMGEYGSMLYHWIGAVEFKVQNEVLKRIDLGEKLAGLEFNDNFGNMPREQREDFFNDWKRDTVTWRQDHGLPTGPSPSSIALGPG